MFLGLLKVTKLDASKVHDTWRDLLQFVKQFFGELLLHSSTPRTFHVVSISVHGSVSMDSKIENYNNVKRTGKSCNPLEICRVSRR